MEKKAGKFAYLVVKIRMLIDNGNVRRIYISNNYFLFWGEA
jgi:hypothetical protein